MAVFKKLGVCGFSKLTKETRKSIKIVEDRYLAFGEDLLITSCADSNHRSDSLHYQHKAWDCRLPNLYNKSVEAFVGKIEDALGDDYDVVSYGNDGYMHIEYDPK